jgi:3-oxoacyl-[acyl-carrier-protein] synthase II
MRRVVVTGVGAITPLGVGVQATWARLIAGHSGITSVAAFEPTAKWKNLTSTVAGIVPKGGDAEHAWRPLEWMDAGEQRRMSTFAQYALAAAKQALDHAGWMPTSRHDLEATGVCIGSGIGNLDEIYSTSLAYEKDVSCTPTKHVDSKAPVS